MFDIGFLELIICAVIALLILGPERLPVAARTAGRWVGSARRMVSQFSGELDRQLKADELRQELRKAGGDLGLEDVQKNVRSALEEARKYENMILPDGKVTPPEPAPASRDQAATDAPDQPPATTTPAPHQQATSTEAQPVGADADSLKKPE
ncbi:Sec-independent protein translocase protein TatB [uncultured Marinobacter sp.]|uniref:Sec-independent protein translocase protein TatB n=1 Tax=uncultured Marinobacter sp. TaxID=187379 RepID=UPI0030DD954E